MKKTRPQLQNYKKTYATSGATPCANYASCYARTLGAHQHHGTYLWLSAPILGKNSIKYHATAT
eukprot:5547339-Prymnesium_polylepis.1